MRPEPAFQKTSTLDISAASNRQQLEGRHARLERELAQAFGMQPWPGALIERLVNELSQTEHEIETSGVSAA